MDGIRIMKRFFARQIIVLELCVLIILCGIYVQNRLEKSNSSHAEGKSANEKYIKWVEFKVPSLALNDAYQWDVKTHGQETALNWITLLACLASENGGDFSSYKSSDMEKLATDLRENKVIMEEAMKEKKYYSYYLEAYTAVLGGMVGEYEVGTKTTGSAGEEKIIWEKKYGLKAFSPIAKGYEYQDYDDFGTSRSYGYSRPHLGHDMMGQIGTPIVAIESGYVENIGWNQYGGWRLGIRSLDKKRYYYYAHLRQNFPYNKSLKEGSVMQGGDVVAYLGHTGYSTKENVNNIDTPHLHWGLQLIFDESQKEGNNEIWVDCYELTRFLSQNRSEAKKNKETKEHERIQLFRDLMVK